MWFGECSGGRDKVILVWDLCTGRNRGTVTVFEVCAIILQNYCVNGFNLQGIEGMVIIPNDACQAINGLAASAGDVVVATAGDKG